MIITISLLFSILVIASSENPVFEVIIDAPVSLGLVLGSGLVVAGFQSSSNSFFKYDSNILKIGDRVVKLNGDDISNLDPNSFAKKLKVTKVPYKLTIKAVDNSERNILGLLHPKNVNEVYKINEAVLVIQSSLSTTTPYEGTGKPNTCSAYNLYRIT